MKKLYQFTLKQKATEKVTEKKKDKDGDKITVNIENILSKDEEKPNPYYNYLDLS